MKFQKPESFTRSLLMSKLGDPDMNGELAKIEESLN